MRKAVARLESLALGLRQWNWYRKAASISEPDAAHVGAQVPASAIDCSETGERFTDNGGNFYWSSQRVAFGSYEFALPQLNRFAKRRTNRDLIRYTYNRVDWVRDHLSHLHATALLNARLADLPFELRFTNLFWAYYDQAAETLSYVNAGQAGVRLYPGHENGQVTFLDETGPTLGALLDPTFDSATVPFSSGDVLLIHARRIVEATSPSGEAFGEQRLALCVRRNRNIPAAELRDAILAEAREFSGKDIDERVPLLVVRGDAA